MIWVVECRPGFNVGPDEPGGVDWVPALWYVFPEDQTAHFADESAARAYEACLRFMNAFQSLGTREFRTREDEDPQAVIANGFRLSV